MDGWELGCNTFLQASPVKRYCTSIPRNDDRIDRYILPITTSFPQFVCLLLTQLFYQIEPLKNGVILILPSSITKSPKQKEFLKSCEGLLR